MKSRVETKIVNLFEINIMKEKEGKTQDVVKLIQNHFDHMYLVKLFIKSL